MVVSGDSSPFCEPIRIPLCISMPYNRTRMPNLLYHSTQRNAILIAEQFQQLVDTNCSGVLAFFLCAMFAPICAVDFQIEPVPPCRKVCQQARDGCEPIMNRYNVSWPEDMDCRKLPTYDSGVCVMPEAIVTAPPSHATTTPLSTSHAPTLPPDCKCQTNLKKLRRKFYSSGKFDYAIDASLKYTKGAGAGHVITQVYVHSVMAQGQVAIPEDQDISLWTTGACHCQAFLQKTRYIILGYEDAENKQLLLDEHTAVFIWNKSYARKIKKWEKKLSRQRPTRVGTRPLSQADSPQKQSKKGERQPRSFVKRYEQEMKGERRRVP